MGRVVPGASCPWGELSLGRVVHGASCLWGELSMGWVVEGRVLMGRVARGASCLGASGPGTLTPASICPPPIPHPFPPKKDMAVAWCLHSLTWKEQNNLGSTGRPTPPSHADYSLAGKGRGGGRTWEIGIAADIPPGPALLARSPCQRSAQPSLPCDRAHANALPGLVRHSKVLIFITAGGMERGKVGDTPEGVDPYRLTALFLEYIPTGQGQIWQFWTWIRNKFF
jgi:hypothetical protein